MILAAVKILLLAGNHHGLVVEIWGKGVDSLILLLILGKVECKVWFVLYDILRGFKSLFQIGLDQVFRRLLIYGRRLLLILECYRFLRQVVRLHI